MKTSHYQLLGGACLLIAAKCNPTSIGSSDISFCADNLFNVEQIGVMEDLILRDLDWKLAFPTALDFCKAYARLLSLDETSRTYEMMLSLGAGIAVAHSSQLQAVYGSCRRFSTRSILPPRRWRVVARGSRATDQL
jgi:hypothetical protein